MKNFIFLVLIFLVADITIAQLIDPLKIIGKTFTLQHTHKTSSGTSEYYFYKVALSKNPIPIKKNGEVSIANLIIYDEQAQKTFLILSEKNKINQFYEYSHKEKKIRYNIKDSEFLSEDINTQFIVDVLLYELIAMEYSAINQNIQLSIKQNTKDIYEIRIEEDFTNIYMISGISPAKDSILSVNYIKDFSSQSIGSASPEELKPSFIKLDIKGKQFKLIIPTKNKQIYYKFAISSDAFITQNNKKNGTSINGIMIVDYQEKKSYLATNTYYVCDKNKNNEIKQLTLSNYSKQLSDQAKGVVDIILYGILSQRFFIEKKQNQYIVKDTVGNQVQILEMGNAPEYIFREHFLCDF